MAEAVPASTSQTVAARGRSGCRCASCEPEPSAPSGQYAGRAMCRSRADAEPAWGGRRETESDTGWSKYGA